MKFRLRSLPPRYDLYVTNDERVIVSFSGTAKVETIFFVKDPLDSPPVTKSAASSESNIYVPIQQLQQQQQQLLEPEERTAAFGKVMYFSQNGVDTDIQYDDYAPTLDAYKRELKIYGLVGILDLEFGKYLFFISKRRWVASVGDKSIFAIESVDCVPIHRQTYLSLAEEQQEYEAVEGIRTLLASGCFYFSYDYDLTNSFQRHLDRLPTSGRSIWPYEVADDRFWWNRFLMLPLLKQANKCKEFILPIICGYVGHSLNDVAFAMTCPAPGTNLPIESAKIETDVILIARMNKRRAGTRFSRRGLDLEGNAAIYVETEWLIRSSSRLASFVQIRASAPWLWYQEPSMKYKPEIVLEPVESLRAAEAVVRHFDRLVDDYSNIVCLNLLDPHEHESQLQGSFERQIPRIRRDIGERIKYHAFNFNRKVPISQKKLMKDLFEIIKNEVDDLGWFICSFSEKTKEEAVSKGTIVHVLRRQRGVVRSNCLDCLDRTNIVQFLVSLRALSFMFRDLGALLELSDSDFHENDLTSVLGSKGLENVKLTFAYHGNQLASFYTGTSAMHNSMSKPSRFPFFKNMRRRVNDFFVSAWRYYSNRFSDSFRQDSIDLLLGNHRGSIFAELDCMPLRHPVISTHEFMVSFKLLQRKQSYEQVNMLLDRNRRRECRSDLASTITVYFMLLLRHFAPRDLSTWWQSFMAFFWLQLIWLWYFLIGSRRGWSISRWPKSGVMSWEGDEAPLAEVE